MKRDTKSDLLSLIYSDETREAQVDAVSVVEVKKNIENYVYVGVYSTQFCQSVDLLLI